MAGTGHSGGRNAKTREQLERAGTFRNDRHAQLRQPDPPKGAPDPPADLKDEALAEWRRMIHRLELSGALTIVDDAILANYCKLHAMAEQLEAAVGQLDSLFFDKFTVDGAGVEPKVHPGVTQLRQFRQALRAFLVEFGLTPAARGRVKLPEAAKEADAFTAFQAQRPGLVRVK